MQGVKIMPTAIADKPQGLRVPFANGVSASKLQQYVTVEEYLRREEIATEKSEYRNGEILPMPGASFPHTLLTNNVGAELYIALKKKRDCTVHSSDLKIHTPTIGTFRYPDIAVVRGEPVRYQGRTDTIQNPVVIIEVLSASTETTDRGDKLEEYQTLESLTEYVLVTQDRARVEVYSRDSGGNWQYHSYVGLEASARLPTLDVTLTLADIYDKVTFPASDKE
ncbi:MAG: Uma2 family endonuclease [Armatimonadetes bacterium]|nr:Uma2 family endonuclease [Armatimonadota bacterium]